ncbi:LamG-like jellyroll fold domain-containing protein [Flavobacterium sp.]|uniref:LamG-like jellyroll fold domain-containing protein n=1 Tax=Flavobacterium sp. TaxID=239 RepID=UPI0026304B34|nr:LamG-like jellyroll fold domain-containing protein [Flavobacterium sp.]
MKTFLLNSAKATILIVALFLTEFSTAQEIDVYGGGVLLVDGGAGTPSLTNQTDFGSTNEQGGTITKSFEIRNIAALGNLTIGTFTIGGANASDFTVTRLPVSPVLPLVGVTTFEVTFNPSAIGVRNATISFVNNDGSENPFNFNLRGTGTSFPTQSHTVYYENFEETDGGWTSSGVNGAWNWTNTIFRGEGNFWRTNVPYVNNALNYLTSPIINTAGFRNVKISLDMRYNTDNDPDDGMQVQYSINGGTTWNVLGTTTENWYSASNVNALSSSLGNRNGWNDLNANIAAPFSQFEEKSTQVNLLDNQANLRFRIVFASDGSNTDSGCAIDNVIIKADPITPFANPVVGPGSVNNNLKLWLKATSGTSTTTDGNPLDSWNDQAYDNNADAIGVTRPTYRNGTRNINFNPIIDFDPANANVMKGKGGFWAQDYFVVVKTNNTLDSSSPTRQVPISGRTTISSFHLDGTAFALGEFTARYVNELVSHSINSVPQTASSNSYGRAYATTTETYVQETTIYNVKTNAAGNSTEIYKNGKRIDNYAGNSVGADQVTITGTLNFSEFNNLQYNLGTGRFSLNGNIGSYLDGKLSEIISYSAANTDVNKKKIESYLAIKNGVTLHASNSVTATNLGDTDYVDSNGTVIWNSVANNGFNYDIAGIGRDDNTQLNQKQSKSENPGTVLTIGLGDVNATNTANTNTFATDRSYLVWGANGGNMNNSGVDLLVDLGPTTITTITEVVNRKWKVVETGGDVATTRVSVPTSAFTSGLPALGPTDAYVMVVATNATFTTGVETVFMATTGANQTCLYDFDSTKFITFGVAHRATNPLHITLDGSDDYVRIDNVNEIGTTFSIMTWVRPNGANDLGTERTIIAKKASATTGYQLVLQNNNRVRMEWYSAGSILRSVVSNTALPNLIWHNIAVTYGSNNLIIYIDGVQDISVSIPQPPIASTSTFSIGAQYINKTTINNLFKGDIDELRMWNRAVTPAEIRFLMNQEILQNGTGTRGTIIPATVTKNDVSALLWNDLFAYYSMNSYIGTHLDDDSININRGSLVIPDKISINLQTAPMPYESNANGLWSANATWRNGAIQDVPYSLSIVNGTTPIDWNIVRTNHNVNSNGNKVVLGLFTHSNTLSATNDSKIEISHHFKLDGILDLQGRAQLVQTLNSDLDPTSSGRIERDQQGTKNIFNYNYWSSPVGAINNTTNNNAFTVSGVMKDGTTSTPQNITWTTGLNGSATSPITLSSYWIFKFQNQTNAYANWSSVGSGGSLSAAQGFTLKGSGTAAANQNYTFVGKPNNGLITTTVAANNLNLAGNPYASALDANAFITANNASTTGSLYFWEHSATNNTHNLAAYQGGYSVRNLVGGTPPSAPAGISGVGASAKVPQRYIPVSQGFFIVGSAAGGTVRFNNDQRAFIKEDNALSTTLFRSNTSIVSTASHFTNNQDDEINADTFKKIRLGLTSKDNYHRQILLGFMDQLATSALDFGYDAVNIDNQLNDIYFINTNEKLAIQGEGTFNVNNVYPIGVKTNVTGEVKIMVDNLENFTSNDNLRVFIHDNADNRYHEITDQPYIVEVPQGLTDNRFSLTFKDNSAALANEDFTIENGIQVAYANTKNILNIKNNVVDATVEQVLLYNLLGQLIATFDVKDQNQQNIELPISGLSSGTYIVKVQTDKGDTSRKIVFN